MSTVSNPGPFTVIFFWVGVISGVAATSESGDLGAMAVAAAILGGAGIIVGRFTDNLVARLIFIFVSVIGMLVNAAIRSALFQLIGS